MEQYLRKMDMPIKKIFILLLSFSPFIAIAQTSAPVVNNNIEVSKDWRLDVLGKKMAEYNENIAVRGGMKAVKGYRLMLLSTNDRQHAINVRSRLLQVYPDQKVYMVYQAPYIKLEFGNFIEKAEAERYSKQIQAMNIITTNIYTIPKTVEVKVEKLEEED